MTAAEVGRREYVMGTLLEIRVSGEDSTLVGVAVDSAFAIVHRFDKLLSNYDSSSELSAIGLAAPKPVVVSEETFVFIAQTRDLCERSGGALDFTIGPVVRLWGFFGEEPRIPDSSALDSALQFVGFHRIRLANVALSGVEGRRLAGTSEAVLGSRSRKGDPHYFAEAVDREISMTPPYPPLSGEDKTRHGAPRARDYDLTPPGLDSGFRRNDIARSRIGFQPRVSEQRDSRFCIAIDSGMALDPGATGKGYALKKAGEVLTRLGVDEFYFDFGGQIYWRAGRPQAVAIRHPRSDTLAVSVLRATGGSVSTSGDYERYFEVDGVRYAHIIDPRTGRPVQGRAAVSVYADDPFVADALSTALFVLGPDAGADLLKQFPGAGALFAEWQGDSLVYVTAGRWNDLEDR